MERRRYESPLRRQQAARTRERIVQAGAKIAHQLATWDWRELTFKAIGKRARVAERTVHRHFSTERGLHDAILQRLVQECGIKLEELELENFAGAVARMFDYMSSFATSLPIVDYPGFASMDQQRRKAILTAVARSTPGWTDGEQEMAGAMLDILWSVPSYERLRAVWQFDTDRAIQTTTWLIGLVETAIREGKGPGQ
jgi:AcrR family transcriptional regulator